MTIDDRITIACTKVGEKLGDGFQPAEDIPVLIQEAVEVTEAIGEVHSLTGAEKRDVATKLLKKFIELSKDNIERGISKVIDGMNLPGPDAIVGPYAKRFALAAVVRALEELGPGLIDLVVDASAGRVAVNGGDSGQDPAPPAPGA